MARPTLKRFKEKALADDQVRAEYDALEPVFELKRKLIGIRRASGLTQEQVAVALKTHKSNISRLESLSSQHAPSVATIEKYARACGYTAEIRFKKA